MRIYLLTLITFNLMLAKPIVYIWTGCGFNKLLSSGQRDECRKHFFMLNSKLSQLGYKMVQVKKYSEIGKNYKALVCFDLPECELDKLCLLDKSKSHLWLWEPPTVKPYNYEEKYHEHFNKVFTLLDSMVDGKKYIKYYEPQPIIKYMSGMSFEDRRLCVMLAGNKESSHPQELYSYRRGIVDFCEDNPLIQFDLFGWGWDKDLRVYKGHAKSKVVAYQKYKFCICCENMRNADGYLTAEKIIYPMICGCVPIYIGGKNIGNYIPEECFIDGSQFSSEKQLFEYLDKYSQAEYQKKIEAIQKYISSPKAKLFSCENFVKIFVENILNEV